LANLRELRNVVVLTGLSLHVYPMRGSGVSTLAVPLAALLLLLLLHGALGTIRIVVHRKEPSSSTRRIAERGEEPKEAKKDVVVHDRAHHHRTEKGTEKSQQALIAQRVRRLVGTEQAVQEERAGQVEDPKIVGFLSQIGQLETQLEASRAQLMQEETVSQKAVNNLQTQLQEARLATADSERSAWHWQFGFFVTQFLSFTLFFCVAIGFWRCVTGSRSCCAVPCPAPVELLDEQGEAMGYAPKMGRSWAAWESSDKGAVAHRPMDADLREKLNRRKLLAEGMDAESMVPRISARGVALGLAAPAAPPQNLESPRCEYFSLVEEEEVEEEKTEGAGDATGHSFDFPTDFAVPGEGSAPARSPGETFLRG